MAFDPFVPREVNGKDESFSCKDLDDLYSPLILFLCIFLLMTKLRALSDMLCYLKMPKGGCLVNTARKRSSMNLRLRKFGRDKI